MTINGAWTSWGFQPSALLRLRLRNHGVEGCGLANNGPNVSPQAGYTADILGCLETKALPDFH